MIQGLLNAFALLIGSVLWAVLVYSITVSLGIKSIERI